MLSALVGKYSMLSRNVAVGLGEVLCFETDLFQPQKASRGRSRPILCSDEIALIYNKSEAHVDTIHRDWFFHYTPSLFLRQAFPGRMDQDRF